MKLNNKKNNEENPFMQVNDNDFLSNDMQNNNFVDMQNNNFVDMNQQQDFNNQPINQYNTNMANQGKKKKSPLLFILIGVVVVLAIIIACVVGGGKDKDKIETPVEEKPTVVENENNVEEKKEEKEEKQEENKTEDNETKEEEPNMAESKILAFEDDMVGIKFNYNSELYMKKNVEDIFNTLKSIIPEDRTDFNIFTDKLNGTLNVCKLTTGKSDGLYINVSVIPFELEKATTTLKIDGTTVIENETIGIVDFNTEELIKNYDIQIKQTVEQMGCEIVEYGESTVVEVGEIEKEGKKLQGIFTSRIYTGPVEATTSTGTVDVVQCTIPVGKNAILITAVTDGRPIEIDKSMLVNEIAESFKIMAEMPKQESEETEKAE